MSQTHMTAYHALRTRAQLLPGELVLVLGAAGGVGLAAVKVARALGAHVIAAASSSAKLAAAAASGAEHLVNYQQQDLVAAVKALTAGRGVDVAFDPVGGPYTSPALRCLAWGGRLLVVGFAAGQIPQIEANRVLLKGGAVLGVRAGEAGRRHRELRSNELAGLLALAEAHDLRPHICCRLPLERFRDALRLLAERQAIGRIVLMPASDGAAANADPAGPCRALDP